MGFLDNFRSFFYPKSSVYSSYAIGKDSKYTYNPADKYFPLDDGFVNTLDVYSVVSRIADKAKEIPVQLVYGEEDEIVTDGELYRLINNPSMQISRNEFYELGLKFLLTSGNVIAYQETPVGFLPNELILLYPQNIDIVTGQTDKKIVPLQYKYTLNDKQYLMNPEDVSHIKNVNPSEYGLLNYWGLSPLQAAYLTVISSRNLDTANASILENRGAIGILSNESEIILSPEEAEKHQKRLNEKMGSAGDFNSVIQSGAKVKYQPIALSPTDLKIIESRVMKLRDLCNAYAVDSSLFNDPANKTYNNRTEAHKSFYSDAVIPTLNKFLTIFRPAINAYSVRENRDYRLKLDLSGVHALQEDENEKAQRGVNISNTIISILASNLTREQKINALVESLQITYERADEMVGNEITFDEGTN